MAELPYVTILVTGDDARDFLQNQLTQDLALADGDGDAPVLAAWCNPKGRVICLMRVSKTAGGYALALPAELAEPVVKRLTMFRFRAKVDFEIRAAEAAELGAGGDFSDWLLDNLRAGVAHIGEAQSEEFTPHMLNLDLVGAISLDKGCYPGQEIVARTHYRGATKRRLFRFTSVAPVDAGADVMEGERRIGEVVNAIGEELLAVVPIDSADATLTVDGSPLQRAGLPYDPKA